MIAKKSEGESTAKSGMAICGGKPREGVERTKEPGWTRGEAAPCAKAMTMANLPSEPDLQLLFARLNYEFFNGEAPDCRIRYNERFSNSAGRISYADRPMTIELSPKHFRRVSRSAPAKRCCTR